MKDGERQLILDAIPRPRVIRERLAVICREQDVLKKLLRVSEYAAEQVSGGRPDSSADREVSNA